MIFRKSKHKSKKYDAMTDNKTVAFGASGYSDFTTQKAEERKNKYVAQRKPSENWDDFTTVRTWAKSI